jgi:hypothetical protein
MFDNLHKRKDFTRIEIVEHPKSLERFVQNGNILYKLGVGKFLEPGHPAGNQQLHSQIPFFNSAARHNFIVYKKAINSDTHYMGEYVLEDYKKKMSFEGFTYFLFRLRRQKNEITHTI